MSKDVRALRGLLPGGRRIGVIIAIDIHLSPSELDSGSQLSGEVFLASSEGRRPVSTLLWPRFHHF